MTRFFESKWNDGVFKARYIIVAVLFVVAIVGGIIASDIGPLTQAENYIDPDHPLIVLSEMVEENFSSTSSLKESLVIRVNWGVAGLDRSGVDKWDPKNKGVLIWDDTFTVSPKAN